LSPKNSLGSASGRAFTERRKTNRKKENVPNQTSIGSASKRTLKVPKCEIFNRSDFPDFYTIKSSRVCDLVVKILTYYFKGAKPHLVSDAYAQGMHQFLMRMLSLF
jgi:hypothetical protein